MSKPIEDYALIGDCHTAALVARDGSIDWMCQPRFDSDACFASLLGTDDHGFWRIAPERSPDDAPVTVRRAYRDHTMVVETVFESASGSVALIDFMPPREGPENESHVIRIVEGRRGRVAMRSEMAVRFNYGQTIPWVTKCEDGTGNTAIAGPDRITLRSAVELRGEGMRTVATFDVAEGERQSFVLSYNRSHRSVPEPVDVDAALARTVELSEQWVSRCPEVGPYTDQVRRSLMVLKALTYLPTGGIVAAPTTSLPEEIGVRNWDYRYCWLRDSTLTLLALMNAGYYDEAKAWGQWVHRAIAGDTKSMRILYGIAGERRIEEWTIAALPGYEDSKPVRIGNEASNQLQLDVYGQLMGSAHQARIGGVVDDDEGWKLQCSALDHLETIWNQPDQSIWESRDGPEQFTFSKLMCWTAFNAAILSAEQFGLEGPIDRWRALRELIREDILTKAYDAERNTFVQSYGSKALDASALLMPFTGFIRADDPRFAGTVAAIERELLVDGLVLRYSTEHSSDGLPPGEGAFLACSFWLVEVYKLQGRVDEATRLFERLLSFANDVGLLAEEYDPKRKRQVGNFPQAFSHVALINAAMVLAGTISVEERSEKMQSS